MSEIDFKKDFIKNDCGVIINPVIIEEKEYGNTFNFKIKAALFGGKYIFGYDISCGNSGMGAPCSEQSEKYDSLNKGLIETRLEMADWVWRNGDKDSPLKEIKTNLLHRTLSTKQLSLF